MSSEGGSTTYGMILCIASELKLQDAHLNSAYRKAQAGLNARQKAKLEAAQKAWMAFRDVSCQSLLDPDWGSLAGVRANLCVLDRTMARTRELIAYPEEDEGPD